ncbi:MAG: hypothetical protein WCK24_04085 [Actinomycetes bacterium]
MKKLLVTTVMLGILLTAGVSASADVVVSPISAQTEVTVRTISSMSGMLLNPQVFSLANGSSLVTWQELSGNGYFQKARTISINNKLGAVQTLNPATAENLDSGRGVQDTVSINRNGKLFGVWVTLGTRYGVASHKIWGRTSVDGANWSKPFVVIPGLSLTGDQSMCENNPLDTPGCGYFRVQAAIDDKGRQAVLVADNIASTGSRYRMKATSFVGAWCNLKTLTATPVMMDSEILGLTSGFAVSATKYGSMITNSVKTSYYDPKLEAWSNTLTPIAIPANTVITAHWVQRDIKNLTIAMAIEGRSTSSISMRNFNVDTKTWSSDLITIQEQEPDLFYPDLRAAKVGADLVVMFKTFNRNTGSEEVRVSKVVGLVPTTATVGTSADQIDLLYVGSSLSNNAVIAYNEIMTGAKLGGITESNLPTYIPNTATHSYLSALIKTRADRVAGVGLKWVQGTEAVIFTQGYLR